jgi:hypothetical protein
MNPLIPPAAQPPRLTADAIAAAAQAARLEPAALAAVVEVETGGAGGFLTDGRPRILFEPHVFSRLTAGRWNGTHPDISRRNFVRGLYLGGAAEYGRLERAMLLDRPAALQSCSWGLFQIMGFNHRMVGHAEVADMVADARASEAAQLRQGVAFIEASGLAAALRAQDWRAFARGYNGPAFEQNAYHTKLEAAFRRHTAPPAPPPQVVPHHPRLALGDRGEAVRRVQGTLRQREAHLQVDGIFGRATEAAVIRFQRRAGLADDGIVGPRTWAALTEAAVTAPTPFALPKLENAR